LFLLGHYEEVWQAVPLGLIALALALVAALIVRTSAAAIIALQIAMTVFIGDAQRQSSRCKSQ
jgi:heme exporter protein D